MRNPQTANEFKIANLGEFVLSNTRFPAHRIHQLPNLIRKKKEKQSEKEEKMRAGGHRSSLAAPALIFVPRTDKTSNQIRNLFYEIFKLKSSLIY